MPIRQRLHAWWEGYEIVPEIEEPIEEPLPPEPSREVDGDSYAILDESGWSPLRADAAESVWGAGYIGPSSGPEVLEMVSPVGLDPKKSVLDVGAGLGGSARLVAQTFSTWVTGLEGSRVLTNKGNEESVRLGMGRKAPIEACDLQKLDLGGRSYDCIYAREAFFTVRNKQELFETLYSALKTDGELAFTDFMLRAPDLSSKAIKRWKKGEPLTPRPWSHDEIVSALRQLRYDVRVHVDITDDYRALVVRGLEEMIARHRNLRRVEAELAQAIIAETELWARRVDAFDSGDLRVYRISARKPELGHAGVNPMSHW